MPNNNNSQSLRDSVYDFYKKESLTTVGKNLGLTPQELNLYSHHLNNLYGEGKVIQENGDISTLLQRNVQGPNGQFYNIPSVWDGKILSPKEAMDKAAEIGWDKWPSYPTDQAAEDRYKQMHEFIDQDAMKYRRFNAKTK